MVYKPKQFWWRMEEKSPKYCKRGNIRVGGNFRIFHTFVFFAKITPSENKTHMAFWRK